MPQVPRPITSDPPVPGQPYDATTPGGGDAQSDAGTIYDAAGGPHAGEPWVKIQRGGAADMSSGRVTQEWPDDGASDGRAWKQT